MLNILDIEEILSNIYYKGWRIKVHQYDGYDTRPYLQVEFGPENDIQRGRKWNLSFHMAKSEVVATAFKACLTAEEHECRESFRYKGAMVYGPHLDVDVLAAVARKKESLDIRGEHWVNIKE